MIEKLDIEIYRAIDKYEIILKINELIDEINKLELHINEVE